MPYNNQYEFPTTYEQWWSIDSELVQVNGEIQGTHTPTGHSILLDLHYELPYDVNDAIQNKLNNRQSFNQTNEQYIENYNNHDNYQSDFNNYPMMNNGFGGNQLATPLSSLETSRQNSYEREERQYYDCNNYYNNSYAEEDEEVYEDAEDAEYYEDGALYYNSRPMR